VEGDNPAEKQTCSNSSTVIGQLTGPHCQDRHYEVKTHHLSTYSFLVEVALERSMVSTSAVERPNSVSWALSKAKPTGSISLGWGEGSPLSLENESASGSDSQRESRRGGTPGPRTSQLGQYGSTSSRFILSQQTSSRPPGSRVIREKSTDVASAMSIPQRPGPRELVHEGEPKWTVHCILRRKRSTSAWPKYLPYIIQHLRVKFPFPGPQPLPQQDVCP